jgi:transposase-like protein
MKITYTDFRCKFCGSEALVRRGQYKGVQYWWCKACERKFADNDALPQMKTPIVEVGSALGMYYRGMSIDEICRHLDQQYNDCPSSVLSLTLR